MSMPPIFDLQPGTVEEALTYSSTALDSSEVFFGHGTDNAWDEAVQLVLTVAGISLDSDRSVLSQTLDGTMTERINQLLHRRIVERTPLPYLLQRAWFAGLELHCDERAIIPRSPIAELIQSDFKPWYTGPGPRRVLDLCCGGGAIGLAVAHYFSDVSVDLVDADRSALALCRDNRALLNVDERARVIQSNLFDEIPDENYDIILCNPPYVDAVDLADMPAEYLREPELSLGSGSDGLDLTHRILAQAGHHLRDAGLLVLEVGNSWPALEQCYSQVPFTWLEFEHGGEGVFVMTAQEWQKYGSSWRE